MKKYMILAAAAALALASCAKFDTSTVSENDGNMPIAFTNYAPKALSKAASANYVEETTLVNNADFDVWGWSTANNVSFNGSNGTKFMGWYTVTYKTGGNSSGAVNTYPDGYRYWPSGDTPDKLSFYAYYPSNGAGITPPAAGLGGYTFTAQSTADTQVDFVVADVVKDQLYDATNSGTDGTVNLTFKHMLTRVQFKFKTTQAVVDDANTDVTITGITLGNIKNTGTLTASYNGTATSTAWSSVSGTASYSPYFPTSALTATASDVAAAKIFLMVPQTILEPTFSTTPNTHANLSNNAQYITVSWDVTTDGITTHNTKDLFLYNCKTTDNGNTRFSTDWDKNLSITYTITVGPQPILFTAEADEWADWTTGYFNVQ